ncbi:hypothetical protein OAO87_02435 [bacterium]|nr:hypothetical protein [bacterium]
MPAAVAAANPDADSPAQEARYSSCWDPAANDDARIEAIFTGGASDACDNDCTCECAHARAYHKDTALRSKSFVAIQPERCNPLACHLEFIASCPSAEQMKMGGVSRAVFNFSARSCEASSMPPPPPPPCVSEWQVEVSTCTEHHDSSSALCSVCAPGSARFVAGACRPCDWPAAVYLCLALVLVFAWFPLLRLVNIRWMPSCYISLSPSPSLERGRRLRARAVGCRAESHARLSDDLGRSRPVACHAGFLQFLGVFHTIAIGWPTPLESLFEGLGLFNLNVGSQRPNPRPPAGLLLSDPWFDRMRTSSILLTWPALASCVGQTCGCCR